MDKPAASFRANIGQIYLPNRLIRCKLSQELIQIVTVSGARMPSPKIACCNLISDVEELRALALKHDLHGIEWSFDPEQMPESPSEESSLARTLASLHPLEVRYHCPFKRTDVGVEDATEARRAVRILQRLCRLVSKAGGRYLTIHVGLGRESTVNLSWDETVTNLSDLVRFANNLGVRVCLENLWWGWTSRPELFEKLIRKTGAWGTFDIGHARVSPSVKSRLYHESDFVTPHPELILNAHVYHEEKVSGGHIAPETVSDIRERLQLLRRLPLCDWWLLELRDEQALVQTLDVVREFLNGEAMQADAVTPPLQDSYGYSPMIAPLEFVTK